MERAKTAFVIYFEETSYHEHSHILTYYDRSINKISLERWRKRAVQFQRFASHAKIALGSSELWCNITYITFSNEMPYNDTSSSSFYPDFKTSFHDIFFSGTSTKSCMLIVFFNSFQHLSSTRWRNAFSFNPFWLASHVLRLMSHLIVSIFFQTILFISFHANTGSHNAAKFLRLVSFSDK